MSWITTSTSPERSIRINITKNTKGYSYETSVSLRWTGEDFDEVDELATLLRTSDERARREIVEREELDAEGGAS